MARLLRKYDAYTTGYLKLILEGTAEYFNDFVELCKRCMISRDKDTKWMGRKMIDLPLLTQKPVEIFLSNEALIYLRDYVLYYGKDAKAASKIDLYGERLNARAKG